MLLYMIRHGQSEANLLREYCGWGQVSLTEKGFADARHAGELLKDVVFDRVYASDLRRAMQTCETALPGISYETTPLLRELSIGSLQGITEEAAEEKFGQLHHDALYNSDFTPFGGENRQMELDRTREFMKRLESCDENEVIAAFCHAGTVCCALELTLGAAFHYDHLCCTNGSVSIFEWTGSLWRLVKWNIT